MLIVCEKPCVVEGRMDGWESRVKDCLQQSKTHLFSLTIVLQYHNKVFQKIKTKKHQFFVNIKPKPPKRPVSRLLHYSFLIILFRIVKKIKYKVNDVDGFVVCIILIYSHNGQPIYISQVTLIRV